MMILILEMIFLVVSLTESQLQLLKNLNSHQNHLHINQIMNGRDQEDKMTKTGIMVTHTIILTQEIHILIMEEQVSTMEITI